MMTAKSHQPAHSNVFLQSARQKEPEAAAQQKGGVAKTHSITLTVPVEGWLAPLTEAPDPVFAEAMMGDGVLIDPIDGKLVSPCAGVIASLPETLHAVTVRAENGAEILMHVGIETVSLKGRGFAAHVREGDRVRQGDLLLSFDLDILASHAVSLQTPVVVTNGEVFRIVNRIEPGRVSSGDAIMTVEAVEEKAVARREAETSGGYVSQASRTVSVLLANGFHARPAARLANEAKKFKAHAFIEKEGKRASARSPVALMTLGVRHGDAVTVDCEGPDAAATVAALADVIASGLGEKIIPATAVPSRRIADAGGGADIPAPVALDGSAILSGVSGSPGLAIGPTARVQRVEIDVSEHGAGRTAELRALHDALATVRARLRDSALAGSGAQGEILNAHLELVDDESLLDAARAFVDQGKSAAFAWRAATKAQITALKALHDPLLAERADDLADLENQVLSILSGADAAAGQADMAGAIVVAEELYPSQFLRLAAAGITGICLTGGGPTSHVSILASEKGVPALVAADRCVLSIPNGTEVILDADRRRLHVGPAADTVARVRQSLEQKKKAMAAARERSQTPCATRDGVRIEILANLGGEQGAAAAVALGAEGCGLLRTEFLYLGRATPPDEEEQLSAYQSIADALGGRPLIVRTLDIGGDKPAPFVTAQAEENPALGLRGVRLTLQRRDLLETQLRAIMRLRTASPVQIMLPMVSSLDEIIQVSGLLQAIAADVGRREVPPLGVMIETPASAVAADILARRAEFFSIGTNDLAQYVLAMDRGNTGLAARIDSLHPAVLRMIKMTASAGMMSGRQVGVCGSLASDPVAAPLLIGLGVTKLSATPGRVPIIKEVIRTVTIEDCRAAADRVLDLASAEEVREFSVSAWPQLESWL